MFLKYQYLFMVQQYNVEMEMEILRKCLVA